MFSLIACWYRKRTRCLSEGVTYLQVPNASLAAATAAFISADVACGTCARTSWVAGFATSYQTSDFDSTNLPFISSGTRGIDPFAPVLRRRIPRGTKLLRTTNFISKLRSRCSRKDVPRRPRMHRAFRLSSESASNYDDITVQVRDAVKMSVDLQATGRELSRQNWMPSTSARVGQLEFRTPCRPGHDAVWRRPGPLSSWPRQVAAALATQAGSVVLPGPGCRCSRARTITA